MLQDAWSHGLDLQIHADEDEDGDEQPHVKMSTQIVVLFIKHRWKKMLTNVSCVGLDCLICLDSLLHMVLLYTVLSENMQAAHIWGCQMLLQINVHFWDMMRPV